MHAPLLFVALSFASGILLFWSFAPANWIGWVVVLLAMGLSVKLQRKAAWANGLLLIALLGVGMVRAEVDQKVLPYDIQYFLTETDKPITVRGIVVSDIEEPRERFFNRVGWFKLEQRKHLELVFHPIQIGFLSLASFG